MFVLFFILSKIALVFFFQNLSRHLITTSFYVARCSFQSCLRTSYALIIGGNFLLIAVSLAFMFPIKRSIFGVKHFTVVSMDVVDYLRPYNLFRSKDSSVVTVLGNSLQVIQSLIPTGSLVLSRPRHCS